MKIKKNNIDSKTSSVDREHPQKDEFQRIVCDKEDVGLVLRKDGTIEFFGDVDPHQQEFLHHQILLGKLMSNLNYFGYSVIPYAMVRQKSLFIN